MDDETVIAADDTDDIFYFASPSLGLPLEPVKQQAHLASLRASVRTGQARQMIPDSEWVELASAQLRSRLGKRLNHVAEWMDANTARFSGNAETHNLRRTLESAIVDLQASIEFCRSNCVECELLCLLPRRHEGPHHCTTSHLCKFRCEILDGHDENEACGLP